MCHNQKEGLILNYTYVVNITLLLLLNIKVFKFTSVIYSPSVRGSLLLLERWQVNSATDM